MLRVLRLLRVLCYGLWEEEMTTMPITGLAASRPRAGGDRVSVALLAAYPTLRQAARMVGVSPSSLSRRNLPVEHVAGVGDKLRPRLVLELAAYYRRRDEYEVGGALVDYAQTHAPDYLGEVEHEIDAYFKDTSKRDASLETGRFLEDARRRLPAKLYAQVERSCASRR